MAGRRTRSSSDRLPPKSGFSRGEPGGVPHRERATLYHGNNRMALVCTLGVFGLFACARRPGPDASMSAVRPGFGRERRARWRVGVQGRAPLLSIDRAVWKTGHLSTRARDEGTAISFGHAISASIRHGQAHEQIVVATRSLSFGVSLGGCLRWGWWLVWDFGVRLWFGLRCRSTANTVFLLAQKDIVRGFRVLAGSRPMIPGQREHGAVVTPAGFRELDRGKRRF